MEILTETWPLNHDGDRRGVRLLAAFAVSLLCHTVVLAVARGWRVEVRPARPLVVTMVERGGGSGDGDASGGGRSPSFVAPAPAAAAVAPADVQKVAPARVAPRRRASSRRAVAVPAVSAAQSTTTAAVASAAEASLGAASQGVAAVGVGAGGSGGASGSRGSGKGGGNGGDGFRAFCRSCPTPDYPGRARRQGWQGTVDVDLAIGGDGTVQVAHVGRSSGYPVLDEVALGVARASRFVVPTGGEGLRGQLRYRFVLDETAAQR